MLKKHHESERLNAAVKEFSRLMFEKLDLKARQGFTGWSDKAYLALIKHKLTSHCGNLMLGDGRQAVDVANLAMFLWWQSLTNKQKSVILKKGGK